MEYLGILITLVVILVYYFINREIARQRAIELMFFIEKNGDEINITEGYQKFKWVVDQFDTISTSIKCVLTKDDFECIVQKQFNRIMKKHL